MNRQEIQQDSEVQDLTWQIEYSRVQSKAAAKVMLISIGVLAALIGLLVPFLAGFPLHAYWDSVGQKLLVLISIPFILSVYLVGQYAIRLQVGNEFRRELKLLLEDRYGLSPEQRTEFNLWNTAKPLHREVPTGVGWNDPKR